MQDKDLDEMVVEEVGGSPKPETEDEETEIEETEVEPEAEAEEEAEEESDEEESDKEEEEDIISIEGETPPEQDDEEGKPAPKWVKDLRKKHREAREENVKLKEELEKLKSGAGQPEPVKALPAKPKLEDFDYDTEAFENAVDKWHDDKAAFDKQQAKAKEIEEEAKQQAVKIKENYEKAKTSLKVPDYDLAEDVVADTLPVALQDVILLAADNPATVVYALGKNKAKLNELAKIDNPYKFAKELGKLEGKLKVERRKAPPPPEKRVKGAANASGVDNRLEALLEEAARTGDMTKVRRYKKEQRGK